MSDIENMLPPRGYKFLCGPVKEDSHIEADLWYAILICLEKGTLWPVEYDGDGAALQVMNEDTGVEYDLRPPEPVYEYRAVGHPEPTIDQAWAVERYTERRIVGTEEWEAMDE